MIRGIAIMGLNGCGKSTLAHTIAKRLDFYVLNERVITSEKGIQSIIDEIKSVIDFYNESSVAGVK